MGKWAAPIGTQELPHPRVERVGDKPNRVPEGVKEVLGDPGAGDSR